MLKGKTVMFIFLSMVIFNLNGCKRLLDRSGSTEEGQSIDSPSVTLSSVSGPIVRVHQILDIHRLDVSKPFVVLINHVAIDRYEYVYYDGAVTLQLENKISKIGSLVVLSTAPVAVPGDVFEVQTL